jgi:hypothetical protein
MQIHQLSISHDEVQDRLLVRLNTQDAQEYRFWLTRRMALRLLPALNQSVLRLEAAQPGVAATDSLAQQILAEIQRDAFLHTADFTTPYAGQAQGLPFGAEPLLVTDVQLSLQTNGSLEVVFQQKLGESVQSCQLNLQAPLVHGLIHLAQETMVKADWDMAAQPTAVGQESSYKLTNDPTVYKH